MTQTAEQRSDIAHLIHGYTDLSGIRRDGPIVITRGDGIRVFDEAGRDYIEAASGMWCAALGFSEAELVDAAIEQMRKLPYYHTLAGRSVNPAIELAEKLAQLVPIDNAHVYFAVSGSEANDHLIKFLWYYNNAIGRPEKKKVITRINSFHGATIVATSLSGLYRATMRCSICRCRGSSMRPIRTFTVTGEPAKRKSNTQRASSRNSKR
jgi:4-aminobutyrate--pyruvate transaminase